jgi:hypothetical protein
MITGAIIFFIGIAVGLLISPGREVTFEEIKKKIENIKVRESQQAQIIENEDLVEEILRESDDLRKQNDNI